MELQSSQPIAGITFDSIKKFGNLDSITNSTVFEKDGVKYNIKYYADSDSWFIRIADKNGIYVNIAEIK